MSDGRYGKVWDKNLTKEFLEEEYSNKKLSPYRIAEDVGCSVRIVYNYIDYHNIPRLDFSGQIESGMCFGLLTVIKVVRKSKNGTFVWKCQCKCGNTSEVPTSRLKNGRSKSCGCYRKRKHNHRWKGYCDVSGSFVSSIRLRARKKGFEFDLDAQFLWELLQKQDNKCAISGIDISLDNNASVDRIDSSMGYIKNNVWWTTSRVNVMKNNMKLEEFIELCKTIASNNKEKS